MNKITVYTDQDVKNRAVTEKVLYDKAVNVVQRLTHLDPNDTVIITINVESSGLVSLTFKRTSGKSPVKYSFAFRELFF